MSLSTGVLLIDDDKTNNFLNERVLRRLDATLPVHTVESGQAALDWLHSSTTVVPSLILLDVNMPGMTGLEFLRQYRHSLPAHNPVIFVLTTTASPAELLPFASLRIAGVLAKPLTAEKIAAVLAQPTTLPTLPEEPGTAA